MKQSIARKELNRTEENGIESIKNEILRIDFDDNIILEIEDLFDDPEYGYEHGVYFNIDGNLFSIDVNDMIEELDNRLGDIDEEDRKSSSEYTVIEYVKKYKDFTIEPEM